MLWWPLEQGPLSLAEASRVKNSPAPCRVSNPARPGFSIVSQSVCPSVCVTSLT